MENILNTLFDSVIGAQTSQSDPRSFFLQNFFLFCVALGVIFMVLRSYRTKRIVVLMPILVVSMAILLSLIYYLEMVTRDAGLTFCPTMFSALGFIIRPLVLFFFMRMTITDRRITIGALIIIGVNATVYLLSLLTFAPAVSHLVLFYENGKFDHGPLFYTCHLLGGFMLLFFIVYSLASLKGRHRYDALACLISTAFIVGAVTLETFGYEYLLNTNIAISCLFYVIHLYQQASVRDGLTGLFDRKAYYSDLQKIENKVTGIISIDMNSLKYINDHDGHEAGDEALRIIAHIISTSLDSKHMDAYRMGGDEFIIISTSGRLDAIDHTVAKIKEEMAKTPYSVAIGSARKENISFTVDEMSRVAEESMYKSKSEFYKTSGIERRKI